MSGFNVRGWRVDSATDIAAQWEADSTVGWGGVGVSVWLKPGSRHVCYPARMDCLLQVRLHWRLRRVGTLNKCPRVYLLLNWNLTQNSRDVRCALLSVYSDENDGYGFTFGRKRRALVRAVTRRQPPGNSTGQLSVASSTKFIPKFEMPEVSKKR